MPIRLSEAKSEILEGWPKDLNVVWRDVFERVELCIACLVQLIISLLITVE